jgi:hypothetical protein
MDRLLRTNKPLKRAIPTIESVKSQSILCIRYRNNKAAESATESRHQRLYPSWANILVGLIYWIGLGLLQ